MMLCAYICIYVSLVAAAKYDYISLVAATMYICAGATEFVRARASRDGRT